MKKPFFTIILTFFMVILPFMMIGCDTSSDSSSAQEFLPFKSGTVLKFVLRVDPGDDVITYGYAELTSETEGTLYAKHYGDKLTTFTYAPKTGVVEFADALPPDNMKKLYLFKYGDSYYFSDTLITHGGTNTVVGNWSGTGVAFILKADKTLTGTKGTEPVTGTWVQDGNKITTSITGVEKPFETWLVKNNGTYHGYIDPNEMTVVDKVPPAIVK